MSSALKEEWRITATAIDSYVGQEVTFYVDTTIPVFLDSYQNPSFVINDSIETNGIDLVSGSIKVTLGATGSQTTYVKTATAGSTEVVYDSTKFTVVEDGTDGYTVTFVDTYLDSIAAAVPVHIEYKGTITNTAEFNANEDDNTVTITYSNGPGNCPVIEALSGILMRFWIILFLAIIRVLHRITRLILWQPNSMSTP